jgi:phospholipid transport system transporter-binding protein
MYRPALTLTVDNAQTVLHDGLRAIADGQTQFDLAEVTAVDSAAVATLIAWQRAAARRGASLVFNHVPDSLQSLIALYGVNELLHPTSKTLSRADLPHH